MTDAATLDDWGHFHDWYLDTVAVGPNEEPRVLKLGLYLGDRRATVTFNGVTCCHLDGFGLLNIVYSLRLTEPSDKDYPRVIAQLNKGENAFLIAAVRQLPTCTRAWVRNSPSNSTR